MSYRAFRGKSARHGQQGTAARLNERGNEIRRAFYLGRDLSHYERTRCPSCEGGETHVICHTARGYRAELRHLVERFDVLLPPALAPGAKPAETPRSIAISLSHALSRDDHLPSFRECARPVRQPS